MNDAVLTKPGAYAQVRIREPAGERTLGPELSIGGEGADVVVPGTKGGAALYIRRRQAVWIAEAAAGAPVRFDGRPLAGARDLRRGDVLAVGDAHVVVADLTRTLLRLEVCHLVGNATIAPMGALTAPALEREDEDVEITAARVSAADAAAPAIAADRVAAIPAVARGGRQWGRRIAPAAVVLVLLAFLALVSLMEPVALDMQPGDADVSTPGTWLSLHVGDRVFVLPGSHVIRAKREGYRPAQARVVVRDGDPASVRLRLAKLPGTLHVDTGGIAAEVSIDGVPSGRAPGDISVEAGRRTITLRAPRYLDYVTDLEIEGAGARQELHAQLRPAWGTLRITTNPPGARVSIDGKERGTAPAALEVMSGVRRVEVAAPGLKTWTSTVIIKAGETLELGPITLGQPDMRLTVRSKPSGAEVSVAGTYRGRTPVSVDVPAGASHEVVVSLPGHRSWMRTVFAEPGRRTTLDAVLEPILARVTIDGEPADAELFVDGAARGRTPQSLELTTAEHRIEVRKAGFQPFTTTVTPASGLERKIHYRLTPSDRGAALMQSAPTITTKTGYVLRLVPGGTFTSGSERREQGRRQNEGQRRVTLKRPFYIGVTEVTNGEFRKFRAGHTSGYAGKQTLDLDRHPVVRVTWEDAVEFCNWLSEREGLPPAYERRNGRYVLKRPVTTGYRLPTEAEWEYAARYAGPDRFLRFGWGDALPIEPQSGNIAGAEAADSAQTMLDSYRDDYPYVAPVGKFRPNALGLHDMAGNVSEWVNDYYLSFVDSTTVTDPLGPEEGTLHVVRGANWQSAAISELRLAWRDGADDASHTLGFRLARYAE